ncbi:MAG: P1 family peptidase [Proteobacteria bacterium]|nr:P1 family peptidase [Pseudomonadota bacterium]
MRAVWLLCLMVLGGAALAGEPRARDLGVPFDGAPGPLNAITDVAGVTVGQVTLLDSGDPKHVVRTGVTAILPRGRDTNALPSFAGTFVLNGNGEMTGTAWLEESGMLEGPVLITNTHSVGVVRDAAIAWRVRAGGADASGYWWSLPVVAETWDGYLNDINGFHVKPEHVFQALDGARGGPVEEGGVGGGTGMICHEFKGGIGTSSRRVTIDDHAYTVGVLVQANYGTRDALRIAGVPVGQHLREHRVYSDAALGGDTGSIIIVVATDAPLLPHQLKRLARRAALGLARNGSYAGNGSGDLFVAFSTANVEAVRDHALNTAQFVGNDAINPLFLGTVEATEEAIVNALVAGRDMQGRDGHYVLGLPHAALQDLLRRYGRLAKH